MRRRIAIAGLVPLWALVCVFAGCGRIHYGATAQPGDAGAGDATLTDAAADAATVDAGRMDAAPMDAGSTDAAPMDATADGAAGDAATPCTTWGPFGTPVQVAGLDTAMVSEWDPSLSLDERTAFFQLYQGVQNLYYATRPDVASPFGTFMPVTELNTSGNENSPTLSPDGLTLFFDSDRPGGMGRMDIWSATRPDTSSPFGTATPVTAINSPEDDGDTWLSYDGLRLYFTSAVGTSYNIYMASRPDTSSPFGNIVSFPELDSPQNDYDICLSRDELEIFIASGRTGGMGGQDLYVAHRPTLDSPFDPPVPVTELNTPYDDTAPWLSEDGTRLYANLNTLTAGGRRDDVWMATRSCMP